MEISFSHAGRIPASLLIFIILSPAAQAAEERSWKKGEIRLCAGYGHSRARGSSLYYKSWTSGPLPITGTDSSISASSRGAIYVGAFFSLFISRNVGFETGFGYLKSNVPNQAVFDLRFPAGIAARRETWEGTGEITAVPLCLNMAGRFGEGKFKMGVSAGVALFLDSFLAESYAGTAAVSIIPEETYDVFRIPVAIEDETWSALGGNFSLSADLRLSPDLALTAEARYFICPAKTFDWKWIPGTYPGLLGNFPSWRFDPASAAEAEAGTSPLRVNPSFFAFSIGIKFLR